MRGALDDIMLEYKKAMQSVLEDSVNELSGKVKLGTPVDTGAARRNWKSNKPIKIGKKYKFYNTLSQIPYIRRLEYGHSDQAPKGFLRINVALWPNIVKKYAEQIR